jgi:LysR family transcriptional regulator, glycine cleavage system transcriptional activator
MLKNRNQLPPLDYLIAFESAATQESFTAAGNDLNISESAISRKIKLLEDHYGCALFMRGHRSIKITAKGRQLLGAIQPSLNQLVNASQDLINLNAQHTITVGATNSAATLWLLPRLQTFNETDSQINIALVSSDRDDKCLADDIDLSILRGEGDWPDYQSTFLFGETVFPVCSPDFMRQKINGDDLKELSKHPLIEVSSEHVEWLTWRTWLQHKNLLDLLVTQSIIVNTYPLAIQAAVDGLGIALGWKTLVDLHLDSGRLVRPFADEKVETKSGYYLLVPKNRKPFAERDVVQDWLTSL